MKLNLNANQDFLIKADEFYRSIDNFFHERGYIQVKTPLLAQSPATEAFIEPVVAYPFADKAPAYLNGSPEYAMKRLLMKEPRPIYQISPAFRAGEISAQHSPEFLMLEWYNPNLEYLAIMDEAAMLICQALQIKTYSQITYAEAFTKYTGLDCLNLNTADVAEFIKSQNQALPEKMDSYSQTELADYLLGFHIQPFLGQDQPLFLTNYPISSTVLAENLDVNFAKRFECYYRGVELCNGYQELTSATVHRQRWAEVQQERQKMGKIVYPLDQEFLTDLEQGFGKISGVALGLQRLLALSLGFESINSVLSYYWTE